MNKELLVLNALKPKVKAFGFNKNELKGVAAKIANNLELDENATEDDINEAIDNAIDTVLPYLELGQKQASRVINDYKKRAEKPLEDEDEEEEEEPKPQKKAKAEKNEDVPAWAQAMLKTMEALSGEVSTMKGEKLTNSRKSRLDELLKDTGSYGQRTLKNFAKMKFENDDEFEEFFDEVEADLKVYNQERANDGLSKLGKTPLVGGGNKEEVLSDDEVKALANL
ncbi:MAG: hypothetical protein IIW42_07845 [Bacteroidaceae bacterium]|nr:hypothetical protein [Bacteroidaceae bacterium]